jgi:endonuclease YncB( thermonuclease family)
LDFAYVRFAKNVSVYDGDSFKADLDEGDHRWEIQRPFRVYGLDTPELAPRWENYEDENGVRDEAGRDLEKAAAVESKSRVGVFVEARDVDLPILIQTIKVPGKNVRDKYGRTLARLYIPISGVYVEINKLLLEEKHARPYGGGKKDKWELLRELGQSDPSPVEVAKALSGVA